MDKTPQLGDLARDRVTTFEGIVVGRIEYLRGCDRLLLQPQSLDDGKPIEPHSFDEPDVELVRAAVVPRYLPGDEPKAAPVAPREKPGGPSSRAPRSGR